MLRGRARLAPPRPRARQQLLVQRHGDGFIRYYGVPDLGRRCAPHGGTPASAAWPRYALSEPCCRSFGDLLDETITESGARFICDLGGGANPALDLEYLSRQRAH